MSRIKLAKELRSQIEANLTATRSMIRIDELSESELAEMVDLYPDYKENYKYETVGEVFKHDGKLYEIRQAHTTQDDWIPSELPALYLNMMPDSVIPEWVQPTGSHDAYSVGDKVIFEGQVYESLIDGNTWSPKDYQQGWEKVTE